MTGASHSEVLAAAAQGDDQALAVLVRDYHDRVYRFGLRVCRDGFDADDAVQEAFAKLARRPEVVRDPAVLSWLMTVVRNACQRLLRPFVRESRTLGERLDDVDDAASPQPDPQEALERWELVQLVHTCIAALDPLSREILILRDLEGMSGDEACRVLGLETAAMKTRLHRARTRLRDELLRRRALTT